jgi:hypothetical protein
LPAVVDQPVQGADVPAASPLHGAGMAIISAGDGPELMLIPPGSQVVPNTPLQGSEAVACFFTADGVRVNSENQRIDEQGNILDPTPLPRG